MYFGNSYWTSSRLHPGSNPQLWSWSSQEGQGPDREHRASDGTRSSEKNRCCSASRFGRPNQIPPGCPFRPTGRMPRGRPRARWRDWISHQARESLKMGRWASCERDPGNGWTDGSVIFNSFFSRVDNYLSCFNFFFGRDGGKCKDSVRPSCRPPIPTSLRPLCSKKHIHSVLGD